MLAIFLIYITNRKIVRTFIAIKINSQSTDNLKFNRILWFYRLSEGLLKLLLIFKFTFNSHRQKSFKFRDLPTWYFKLTGFLCWISPNIIIYKLRFRMNYFFSKTFNQISHPKLYKRFQDLNGTENYKNELNWNRWCRWNSRYEYVWMFEICMEKSIKKKSVKDRGVFWYLGL